jgi:hypothetical protein
MRFIHTVGLLIALATTARAQGNPDTKPEADTTGFSIELDKRHGFLGVKLDTPLASFKDLQLVRNKDGEVVYRRKIEQKNVGEATLKTVEYYFYKGKLGAIQVHAENTSQNEAAWMELLKTAYQVEPSAVISDSEYHPGGTYFWHGKHTDINYSVYAGDDISIYVSCADIREQKTQDRVQRVKQAADKL